MSNPCPNITTIRQYLYGRIRLKHHFHEWCARTRLRRQVRLEADWAAATMHAHTGLVRAGKSPRREITMK
jgi:hypothetical protein